jgi:hypothetical protein
VAVLAQSSRSTSPRVLTQSVLRQGLFYFLSTLQFFKLKYNENMKEENKILAKLKEHD